MNSFEAPIGGITLGRRFAAQLVRRFPERRNYAAVLARVLIRAFRYLDQGDARLRAGDTTGARIAWLWHENNDVPGDLTDPAPIQAEGDWALATVAHWRQAQADPRACHALRSVHRLWRAGDSVHQRRAAWADSMARRAECPS